MNGPLDPFLIYTTPQASTRKVQSDGTTSDDGGNDKTGYRNLQRQHEGLPPGMECDRRHAARTLTLAAIFVVSDCIARQRTGTRMSDVLCELQPSLATDNLQGVEFADLTCDLELTCAQALQRKAILCYFESLKPQTSQNADPHGLWRFSRICSVLISANRDPVHCATVGQPLQSTRQALVDALLAQSEELGAPVGLQESAKTKNFPNGAAAHMLTMLLKQSRGDAQWAARMHFEKQQRKGKGGPPPPPFGIPTADSSDVLDVVPWEAFGDPIPGEVEEKAVVDVTFDVAARVFQTSDQDGESSLSMEDCAAYFCAELPPDDMTKSPTYMQWCYCRDIALMAKASWQCWPPGTIEVGFTVWLLSIFATVMRCVLDLQDSVVKLVRVRYSRHSLSETTAILAT
eukprot:SAG31_NODE_357_length_17115_cov_64.211801_3_plen_402_part_00